MSRALSPWMVLALMAGVVGPLASVSASPPISLEPGDRIVVLGDSLASRFLGSGWLEAHLHARFPELRLRVRNLARPGTTDFQEESGEREYLELHPADVILWFPGNPSLPADLEASHEALRTRITHRLRSLLEPEVKTRAPRELVVFTPLAPEMHSATAPGRRAVLERTTLLLEEVTRDLDVPLVDLFTLSQRLRSTLDHPLTLDGAHLDARGEERVSGVIERALSGALAAPDPRRLASVREALQARLGQALELREILHRGARGSFQSVEDALSASDRLVWARAREERLASPTDTNPSSGATLSLSSEPPPAPGPIEGLENLQVRLVASGDHRTGLGRPLDAAMDSAGQLWLAVETPGPVPTGRLGFLVDDDRDGKAEAFRVFADSLPRLREFELWNGVVYAIRAGELLSLEDLDGDGRADRIDCLLEGMPSSERRHPIETLSRSPAGWLHLSSSRSPGLSVRLHPVTMEVVEAPPLKLDPTSLPPDLEGIARQLRSLRDPGDDLLLVPSGSRALLAIDAIGDRGRVQLVSPESESPTLPVSLESVSIPGLLDLLSTAPPHERDRIEIELSSREPRSVLRAASQIAGSLPAATEDPALTHRSLLRWYRQRGMADRELFLDLATSTRSATRLEALEAISEREAELGLSVTDVVKQLLETISGAPASEQGEWLRHLSVAELLEVHPPSAPVLLELIEREDFPAEGLGPALRDLARWRESSEVRLVLETLEELDRRGQTPVGHARTLAGVLVHHRRSNLVGLDRRLVRLGLEGQTAEARRAALASLLARRVRPLDLLEGVRDRSRLSRDLLEAARWISDTAPVDLYERLRELGSIEPELIRPLLALPGSRRRKLEDLAEWHRHHPDSDILGLATSLITGEHWSDRSLTELVGDLARLANPRSPGFASR